jgi:hypothetical protein
VLLKDGLWPPGPDPANGEAIGLSLSVFEFCTIIILFRSNAFHTSVLNQNYKSLTIKLVQ